MESSHPTQLSIYVFNVLPFNPTAGTFLTFGSRSHTHLMGPTNEVHVMFVEELCDHVSAKSEGDTTVVLAPAQHIFVWVSPQQVAQEALVRHISGAHDPSDLLHRLEVW